MVVGFVFWWGIRRMGNMSGEKKEEIKKICKNEKEKNIKFQFSFN